MSGKKKGKRILSHTPYAIRHTPGFTLIETLVAVSFLTFAIVAPMALVSQSLRAAFYARDQVSAYNLAQEGVEAVRALRDGNILRNALYNENRDLLADIPINSAFTIDARVPSSGSPIETCATNPCAPLQTDGTLYGYGFCADGSCNTKFTRSLVAQYAGPSGVNGGQDEIRLEVTVTWRVAGGQTRSFTISENMYRWVEDGAAQ